MKALDLTGQRFGRLVVLDKETQRRGTLVMWRCRCDCRKEVSAAALRLRNGQKQSCGCLHDEMAVARLTKHGMTHSPEYMNWQAMRQRCLDPNSESYRYYGGRGIRICARWDSFENFYADMGPRPFPGATVDRIKSEGNYEPDNCEWATRAKQTKNRRTTPKLTAAQLREVRVLRGTVTQRAIAKKFGVSQSFISRVFNKRKSAR